MEPKWSNAVCKRVLLTGFTLCVVLVTLPTSAIDIHADPEVIVQNGTAGVLRCTFKSSEVVSSATSVSWSFQSSQPDNKFSKSPYAIYYYSNGKGFPGEEEFRDRVEFVGDINKRDVSIQLNPTQFSDNGTFICDVKNPPDVKGMAARTELGVVLKGEDMQSQPHAIDSGDSSSISSVSSASTPQPPTAAAAAVCPIGCVPNHAVLGSQEEIFKAIGVINDHLNQLMGILTNTGTAGANTAGRLLGSNQNNPQ